MAHPIPAGLIIVPPLDGDPYLGMGGDLRLSAMDERYIDRRGALC